MVHLLYGGRFKNKRPRKKNLEKYRGCSIYQFVFMLFVCWCPFTGQQDHRNDLSHPIHADNCLLDPEANECWKEPPAYTYRDYRYDSLKIINLLCCSCITQWNINNGHYHMWFNVDCTDMLTLYYTFFISSALLYLNGDFEGGEFIFTEMDAKTVTVRWFLLKCEIYFTQGTAALHKFLQVIYLVTIQYNHNV